MRVIKDAIYDKLTSHALLSAAVGTRIYNGLAPQTATYPLVTISLIGGGTISETPQEAADPLYLVSAISKVSAAQADQLAEYIHAALHMAKLTVTGWSNTWTAVGNHLEAVELQASSGVLLWQAGRFIRIRVDK